MGQECDTIEAQNDKIDAEIARYEEIAEMNEN
jgi:hypothetical protein